MVYNKIILRIMILFFLVFVSCEENIEAPKFQQEVTVFGYLWNGRPLRKENGILITYTKPITEYYDLAQAAITNAKVFIIELETARVYTLYPADEYLGFFYNDSLIAQANKSYRLEINAGNHLVTAVTRVPKDLICHTQLEQDAINYYYPYTEEDAPPLYLECEDENQIIYIDMFCNQTFSTAEYIKPFNKEHLYPQNQEEYDGGRNGPPRHLWTFMRFRDLSAPSFSYQHVIYWYQAMFVFYGSNTLLVLAIDDNYHRFLYSEHPELSGGIKGGIGVFGSVSGCKFEFFVSKQRQ